MAQKHIQILLLLLAYQAYAQVPDFEIRQNGFPLTGNLAEIEYGIPSPFSVKMEGGGEGGYTWSWCENQTLTCYTGQNYTISASDNIAREVTMTVKAEKEGLTPSSKSFTLRIVPTYTVSFNLDGGSPAIDRQIVRENKKAGKPSVDPTKVGYNFLYWYEGANSSSAFNFDMLITKNIILTAKWELQEYNLTFVPNNGGEPWIQKYTIITPPIPISTFLKDNCSQKFEGWFDNQSLSGIPFEDFIPASNLENKTFYAKWRPKGKQAPSKDLLIYETPGRQFVYDGSERMVEVNPKPNECEIGKITVLYEGLDKVPKEAGTYNISVLFEGSEYYNAGSIPLDDVQLIIKKFPLAGPFVFDYDVADKDYDGTKDAKVERAWFRSGFPSGYCFPEKDVDYTFTAKFDTSIADHNTLIPNFVWKQGKKPIDDNCELNGEVVFYDENKSANIRKAHLDFDVIVRETYIISNLGTFKPRVVPDFISEEDVIFEYREYKEDEDGEETGYSQILPNAIGIWQIRATLEDTDNHFGAKAVKSFTINRDPSKPIVPNIKFEEGFERDPLLSGENKEYFVLGSKNCKLDGGRTNTFVKIEISEPGVSLKKDSAGVFVPPDIVCDGSSYCEEECENEECSMRYYVTVDIDFDKPGLDTLIYRLSFKDGSNEQHLLLIETPVPFESVVEQRWNNTFFVNNNPKTNGGYSFSDFTWFQNDKEVGKLQFYSAGPKSTDELKTSDTYKVQMHYLKGDEELRISTCNGHRKPISVTGNDAAFFKKQVLGIGGKKASIDAKVYNSKGCVASGNAPGVYLVEEK
jgi:uncharacterized repeat protein (TIGR02543 family)